MNKKNLQKFFGNMIYYDRYISQNSFFVWLILNCYFKIEKNFIKQEKQKKKKTRSFLSNYSLCVRDMLLVRPQKKSSKTVSCNIAVQKKFGTREWRYLVQVNLSTITTFIDMYHKKCSKIEIKFNTIMLKLFLL